MAVQEQSLEGDYHFKMDSKGRVAIPAPWCLNSEEKLRLMTSQCHGFPAVKILRESRFEQMKRQIDELEGFSVAELNDYRDLLHQSCTTVQIGGQNKLLIPRPKCAKAELVPNEGVTLIGRGNGFDIMSESHFDAMTDQQMANTKAVNDKLGFF